MADSLIKAIKPTYSVADSLKKDKREESSKSKALPRKPKKKDVKRIIDTYA